MLVPDFEKPHNILKNGDNKRFPLTGRGGTIFRGVVSHDKKSGGEKG